MGWGDVRYCFAMAILVIIIITSPRLLSGDVLLFYVSFSLLLRHPEQHPQLVERDKPTKIGISWTSFAAVAMETKKGGI
jgi:hypothetical protein